jgi:hypothetical protein
MILSDALDRLGGMGPNDRAFGTPPEGEDLTLTLPCKGQGLSLSGIQTRASPELRYGTGPGALAKGPPVLLARHWNAPPLSVLTG